jgi:hypothetical protein
MKGEGKGNEGETHDGHEKRTWRERMHVSAGGELFIPPMALKNCLAETAKYANEKIPGKGHATYTKKFVSGILVPDPMMLGVQADTVKGQPQFVPADGVRGGGKRVWKTFPVIPTWKTIATIVIIDPVCRDKLEAYLVLAGQVIGLLWFRPACNGVYGRFVVSDYRETRT